MLAVSQLHNLGLPHNSSPLTDGLVKGCSEGTRPEEFLMPRAAQRGGGEGCGENVRQVPTGSDRGAASQPCASGFGRVASLSSGCSDPVRISIACGQGLGPKNLHGSGVVCLPPLSLASLWTLSLPVKWDSTHHHPIMLLAASHFYRL